MDFNKYKSYLQDYLKSKGFLNFSENINCPFHDDQTPSMKVHPDGAKCFAGCGHKDIYDFVQIFENINDKAEQYKFIEKKYGAGFIPEKKNKKQQFKIDQECVEIVTKYIRNQIKDNKDYILQFCKDRGYVGQKAEIFSQYLGYWPGINRAIQDIGEETLFNAGISKKTWNHEGVVCRFENGFKLHYIENDVTKKYGSLKSHTFPYPKIIDDKKIMLVEGELDAVSCRISGINQAVSTGGTNGINKQDIDKLLTFEEIIICFDGDDPGRKASSTLTESIQKAGFSGIIKIVELPEGYDPDKLVKEDKENILFECIENAKIYTNKENNNDKNDFSSDIFLDDSNINSDQQNETEVKDGSNNYSDNIYNFDNNNNDRRLSILLDAIQTQGQSLFADILKIELDELNYRVVTEVIDKRNHLKYYIKKPDEVYFTEALSFQELSRKLLEKAINKILTIDIENIDNVQLINNLKKTINKLRGRDFINAVIDLYGRKSDVIHAQINWNQTPECLPCLDGILDFSSEKIISRQPFDTEYFINPINYKIDEILNSSIPETFLDMLKRFFPNPDTQETAKYCLSQMIANKGFKTFQIWCSSFGNNGKNTIIDYMKWLLNNRCVMLSSSIIMRDGDKSERRFGTIQLQGCTAGVFDESAELEHLAINQIKKLTSLSTIIGEAKGINAKEFNQTWTLIALTNELPRFYPADDMAFLSRLITLPFSAVFYANNDVKYGYIQKGVLESNLHPEINKDIIMNELKTDGAGVLKLLVEYYLTLKNLYNLKIPLSKECEDLKKKYTYDNDLMGQFIDEYFIIPEDKTKFVKNEDIKNLYYELFSAWPPFNYMKKIADRYHLEQTVRKLRDNMGNLKSYRGILGLEKKIIEDNEHVYENYYEK